MIWHPQLSFWSSLEKIENLKNKFSFVIIFQGFCYFFGAIITTSGFVILVLKKERRNSQTKITEENDENGPKLTLTSILKLVWKLMKIYQMRKLIFILLTIRVIF